MGVFFTEGEGCDTKEKGCSRISHEARRQYVGAAAGL